MNGPEFQALYERGNEFRAQFELVRYDQAVNIWHDCVGHSLFYKFTPPTLEGEFLSGRHQHLVMCGNPDEVMRAAPAKFDIHLAKVDLQHDPEALATRNRVLATLESYLETLPQFDNLLDYNKPFFNWLRKEKRLP